MLSSDQNPDKMKNRGKWILLGTISLWLIAAFCVKDRVFHPWVSAAPHSLDSYSEHRQELIELLDRIVRHQHYYRDAYGRYTQFLNRTGIWIPRKLSAVYEIRVTEASVDSLMVTAVSEIHGKVQDRISIDHRYQVTANFPLPEAREVYLKALAERAIRRLSKAPDHPLAQDALIRMVDRGVFRNHYKYEIQKDSKGKVVVTALGVRAPVLNSRLEYRSDLHDHESQDWESLEGDTGFRIPRWVEQFALDNDPTESQQQRAQTQTYEEAFLARKIFEGEIGRAPRGWDELQWIGDFGFEGRQTLSFDQIPSDLVSLEALRLPRISLDRTPSSQVSSANSSGQDMVPELIIEEIREDEAVKN